MAANPNIYSFKYYDSLDATETENKKTLKKISKKLNKKLFILTTSMFQKQMKHSQGKYILSHHLTTKLFTYTQKRTVITSWSDDK